MPVPVMGIGPVRVGMLERFVDVLMGMRLRPGTDVPVGVVKIAMRVLMGVDRFRMIMEVGVFLPEEKPGSQGHQGRGRPEGPDEGLMQDDQGGQAADERGEAEKSPGPESPEFPKGPDEQNQAEAVSEGPDRQAERGPGLEPESGSRSESDRRGDGSGGESFHGGDQNGIFVRDISRDIVIEPPEAHGQEHEGRAGGGDPAPGRVP